MFQWLKRLAARIWSARTAGQYDICDTPIAPDQRRCDDCWAWMQAI